MWQLTSWFTINSYTLAFSTVVTENEFKRKKKISYVYLDFEALQLS